MNNRKKKIRDRYVQLLFEASLAKIPHVDLAIKPIISIILNHSNSIADRAEPKEEVFFCMKQ